MRLHSYNKLHLIFIMQLNLKLWIVLFSLWTLSTASITAVSSIKECINDGSGEILRPNGTACRKKLVVAMTVQANEGKSQHLEADIRRLHDATQKKNVQLKTPVRITITKSPVLINYRLYQVAYVNNYPQEKVVHKRTSRCRQDWFSWDHEAACGFQYSNGRKIFDSQGFCCKCNMGDQTYDRGESVQCLGRSKQDIAHCLRMDPLYNYVFGLYPPQLLFNINITIDKVSYTTMEGQAVYERLETLVLGPTHRKRTSNDSTIRAEYIADFHPDDYMPVLVHKYLLIPDIKKINSFPSSWRTSAQQSGLWQSIQNASEWLLVGKEKFAFSGRHCNKIGVSYSAFKHQSDGCTNVYGSCLQGQPYHYWSNDIEKKKSGRKGQYMAYNFGRVHSLPHSNNRQTDFQLNFIAQRTQRSLITITMEADSLKTVINKSPGRIIEAYIDAFEGLSTNGLLNVYVQNIGDLTATYKVFVSHCSAGIDWVPSETVTLDPGEQTNVSFTMHSFHTQGQINTCEVELLDQSAELLHNMTVHFETLDTCFCYGYCGCSCGNNVSDCPPKPNYHDPDNFREFNLNINIEEPNIQWLKDFSNWMKWNFGGIIISTWIILALFGLGILKVAMMLYKGEVSCPMCTKPAKATCQVIFTIAAFCGSTLCSCLSQTTTNLAWGAGVAATGKDRTKYIGREGLVSKNAKRPINCDGMCRGAKQARRIHRKKLRLLKRRGAKTEKMVAWWEKSYNCTCVVKETRDVLEILKGLFFFIYCPLLPLWWVVEFFFEWIRRKRRRKRRLQEYRQKKQAKQTKDEQTYLMLDQYFRGTTEKKVVDFKNETKKVNKKSKKGDKTKVLEEGRISSDESAKDLGLDSSDTTDTDEAGDIDELLNPDYPVYFNFAGATTKNIPTSLQKPGKNFSIKGKLTQKKSHDKTVYVFELDKYNIQVKGIKGNKLTKLDKPVQLDPKDFKRTLQANIVRLLVTIKPLFHCINDIAK